MAGILGTTPDELRRRPSAYDFRAHCSRVGHIDYREAVWEELVPECTSYEGDTLWFHATRVPPDTPFREQGLLPSAKCIDGIKDRVKGIIRDLGVVQRGGCSYSYLKKLELMPREGPFGFLIRDSARDAKEFLKAPELVRDIAESLVGDAAERVSEAYRARPNRVWLSSERMTFT